MAETKVTATITINTPDGMFEKASALAGLKPIVDRLSSEVQQLGGTVTIGQAAGPYAGRPRGRRPKAAGQSPIAQVA